MKSLLVLSFYLVTLHATKVTFKVIVPDAKSQVQVKVENTFTYLHAPDADVPYYIGTAELKDGQTYNYVADGVSESFQRTMDGTSSTRNEFFGRPVTYANIPELPSILTENSWTRGDVEDPIWDSNYIPSIFVTGDTIEMNNLITNVPKLTYKTKITFIGPDSVHTFEDCTFGLHKPGRKNNDAKQSWIWALPEGKFMANRNWFKIRHMEEDPTQQREKLYADILRKMGTYANEANMIRFFINKEGMGTFNLLDDVVMYSYINAMFYRGNTPQQLGGLFDGASGASFAFPGDFDSFVPNVESPVSQEGIAPFARSFASVNFAQEDQVKAIADYFDYDQFLRFMIMEFLTGDWDGYWQEQTNDGAYIDLNDKNKVYFLGQDFDATFGINLQEDRSFVSLPYTEFTRKFPHAVVINRLLESPLIKNTFETYLKITVEKIFNRQTLGDYLNARYDFIAPDLQWDRSIVQRSPGNNYGWTFEQAHQNLLEGVYGSGEKTGGADWGLLEWIEAKEKAVNNFFHIQDATPDLATSLPSLSLEPTLETNLSEKTTLKASQTHAESLSHTQSIKSNRPQPTSPLTHTHVSPGHPQVPSIPSAANQENTKVVSSHSAAAIISLDRFLLIIPLVCHWIFH